MAEESNEELPPLIELHEGLGWAASVDAWIAVKRKLSGTIDFWKDLDDRQREQCTEARGNEFGTMVELGTLRPMTVAEEHPDPVSALRLG